MFGGIDLAASERKYSGICFLNGKFFVTKVLNDEEILNLISKFKPRVVAIDAPLSKPIFNKSFRMCDLELIKMKIKFFPLNMRSMKMLTERGINLKNKIEKRFKFLKVIETYPGACYDILSIKRKSKEDILKFYESIGLKLNKNLSKDEIDSIMCAIVARSFYYRRSLAIGNKKEGQIFLIRQDKKI